MATPWLLGCGGTPNSLLQLSRCPPRPHCELVSRPRSGEGVLRGGSPGSRARWRRETWIPGARGRPSTEPPVLKASRTRPAPPPGGLGSGWCARELGACSGHRAGVVGRSVCLLDQPVDPLSLPPGGLGWRHVRAEPAWSGGECGSLGTAQSQNVGPSHLRIFP